MKIEIKRKDNSKIVGMTISIDDEVMTWDELTLHQQYDIIDMLHDFSELLGGLELKGMNQSNN